MRRGTAADSDRARVRGVVFDVDGTLLLSNRSLGDYAVLPGAIEVLSTLKKRHVPFALLTNGSAYPPAEQAAKLRNVGLPVDDEQMFTPSSIAADHMQRAVSGARWFSGPPVSGMRCAQPASRRCTPEKPVPRKSAASSSGGIRSAQ